MPHSPVRLNLDAAQSGLSEARLAGPRLRASARSRCQRCSPSEFAVPRFRVSIGCRPTQAKPWGGSRGVLRDWLRALVFGDVRIAPRQGARQQPVGQPEPAGQGSVSRRWGRSRPLNVRCLSFASGRLGAPEVFARQLPGADGEDSGKS